MRAKAWRCGECGAVPPGDADVEAHFQSHPVPINAVLAPACTHAPLVVDVSPGRVYLWMSTEDIGDPALSLHPGWTLRRAPAAISEVVERENGASLTTPGWYYPHARSSAAALDRLYHEIVRANAGSRRPLPRAGVPGSPAPSVPRADVRAALLEPRPKRRKRIIATVELVSGIVAGILGSNLMYLCTAYVPFDGCSERGYGFPGFAVLFIGICLGLVGLGSLVATLGKDMTELPPEWRPGGYTVDPKLEAGAERIATILWAAILMAVLVAVEALPIYNLVVLTSSGPHPTFNLGAFLVDMAFFGIADAFIVFLVVTYGSNN